MLHQIFISYRREGGEVLGQLMFQQLTELGYHVFFDVESLRSGKFNKELFKKIDECKDILVILPPGGLDRCKDEEDWVRKEIAYAIQKGKNIIPVMMRGFQFPDDLPDDIDEIRYYNGIEAAINMFPAVMDRLTTKLFISKPSEQRGKRTAEKKSLNMLSRIIAIAIILLPFIIKYAYHESWKIPQILRHYCESVQRVNIFWYVFILGAVAFYCVYYNTNLEYLKKKYADDNLGDVEFDDKPEKMFVKLMNVTEGKNIKNDYKETRFTLEENVFCKNMNGLVLMSVDGEKTDYFWLHGKQWHDFLRIFYINHLCTQKKAIKLLTAQGFVFSEMENRILHFYKHDLHIRLAYFDFELKGLEVCRGDVPTHLLESLAKEKEESIEQHFSETKKNIKDFFQKFKKNE